MDKNTNLDLKFALNEIQNVYGKDKEIENAFTEILKDEINSLDESEIYNNVINLIRKYINDENSLKLIDEVIEAISGGASMTEILLVARDEVVEPIRIKGVKVTNIIDPYSNNNNSTYNDSENKQWDALLWSFVK